MPRSIAHAALSYLLQARNSALNRLDAPVIVLLYHRVTCLASDPQMLTVTPSNFRSQLRYLKDNYPVLRIDDDLGSAKESSVVITFDDGYADNVLEALPILEELEIPATFFISTANIGSTNEFWWDELERLILGRWKFPATFSLEDVNFSSDWPTVTVAERFALYQQLQMHMKRIDVDRREGWLGQLRRWVQAGEEGRGSHRVLGLEELRCLADCRLVTVGAHTKTHTSLSTLPADRQLDEIAGSKLQLESLLDREIKVFSYPFGGVDDYSQISAKICKAAGFSKAMANFPGQVHRWTDPFQIPRRLVRNWTLDDFIRQMRRFWIL